MVYFIRIIGQTYVRVVTYVLVYRYSAITIVVMDYHWYDRTGTRIVLIGVNPTTMQQKIEHGTGMYVSYLTHDVAYHATNVGSRSNYCMHHINGLSWYQHRPEPPTSW